MRDRPCDCSIDPPSQSSGGREAGRAGVPGFPCQRRRSSEREKTVTQETGGALPNHGPLVIVGWKDCIQSSAIFLRTVSHDHRDVTDSCSIFPVLVFLVCVSLLRVGGERKALAGGNVGRTVVSVGTVFPCGVHLVAQQGLFVRGGQSARNSS